MNKEKLKIGQIILLVLMLATVIFAFVQSMLPPEKSEETSGAVGDAVGEIIPPDTNTGAFIQLNLRKIAHFIEFAALGIECALYMMLYKRKLTPMLLSFPFAVIVAFFDESIQLLSGRGPSISDMWLDFAGFASLSLLTYLLYFAVLKISSALKDKKEKTE